MDYATLQEKMVAEQLMRRGITDPRVLDVMRRVPRHEFVPEEFRDLACEDHPITIGYGQTISQPYIVALMTQTLELRKEDVVLEIGTGCGYQTAVLAELCREVFSIERIASLAHEAKAVLHKLGYRNIKIKVADGSLGWQEGMTFDAIVVTAAAPDASMPFQKELKDEGRMVIPIGDRYHQTLFRFTRNEDQLVSQAVCQCVFVPLIGQFGWSN